MKMNYFNSWLRTFALDDFEDGEIPTQNVDQIIAPSIDRGEFQRIVLKDCKKGDIVWIPCHDNKYYFIQIEIMGNIIDNNGKDTDQVAYRKVGSSSYIYTTWANIICYTEKQPKDVMEIAKRAQKTSQNCKQNNNLIL